MADPAKNRRTLAYLVKIDFNFNKLAGKMPAPNTPPTETLEPWVSTLACVIIDAFIATDRLL